MGLRVWGDVLLIKLLLVLEVMFEFVVVKGQIKRLRNSKLPNKVVSDTFGLIKCHLLYYLLHVLIYKQNRVNFFRLH